MNTVLVKSLSILQSALPAIVTLLGTQVHSIGAAEHAQHVDNLTDAMGAIQAMREELDQLEMDSPDYKAKLLEIQTELAALSKQQAELQQLVASLAKPAEPASAPKEPASAV